MAFISKSLANLFSRAISVCLLLVVVAVLPSASASAQTQFSHFPTGASKIDPDYWYFVSLYTHFVTPYLLTADEAPAVHQYLKWSGYEEEMAQFEKLGGSIFTVQRALHRTTIPDSEKTEYEIYQDSSDLTVAAYFYFIVFKGDGALFHPPVGEEFSLQGLLGDYYQRYRLNDSFNDYKTFTELGGKIFVDDEGFTSLDFREPVIRINLNEWKQHGFDWGASQLATFIEFYRIYLDSTTVEKLRELYIATYGTYGEEDWELFELYDGKIEIGKFVKGGFFNSLVNGWTAFAAIDIRNVFLYPDHQLMRIDRHFFYTSRDDVLSSTHTFIQETIKSNQYRYQVLQEYKALFGEDDQLLASFDACGGIFTTPVDSGLWRLIAPDFDVDVWYQDHNHISITSNAIDDRGPGWAVMKLREGLLTSLYYDTNKMQKHYLAHLSPDELADAINSIRLEALGQFLTDLESAINNAIEGAEFIISLHPVGGALVAIAILADPNESLTTKILVCGAVAVPFVAPKAIKFGQAAWKKTKGVWQKTGKAANEVFEGIAYNTRRYIIPNRIVAEEVEMQIARLEPLLNQYNIKLIPKAGTPPTKVVDGIVVPRFGKFDPKDRVIYLFDGHGRVTYLEELHHLERAVKDDWLGIKPPDDVIIEWEKRFRNLLDNIGVLVF